MKTVVHKFFECVRCGEEMNQMQLAITNTLTLNTVRDTVIGNKNSSDSTHSFFKKCRKYYR